MSDHRQMVTSNRSIPDGYLDLLDDVKREITGARLRTALAVNTEMIALYWRIGRLIVDRQADEGWGAKVIDRLSADLRAAFPQVKGFSATNLKYMRMFALAWPEFGPQSVDQIPWGHTRTLLDRFDDPETMRFYARRAATEGWSRSILLHHIKLRLHERVGIAPTTFDRSVPPEQREAVAGLTRDPYVFDFLNSDEATHERDLESRLLAHIARFLHELGAGFAFVGRQHCLIVGGEEFFVDLLFYHLRLRRYVVIELKVKGFAPEHVGKLSFYVNVVDGQLRDPTHDQPTIGILLVAERNDVVVEYALQTANSPLAVSRYDYGALPPDVRASLPSADELTDTISSALHDEE
ncbi:MAG TPA: PDDEXK nuclease domain-containing protein [Streptosporangiaceae bacterium]